MVALDLVCWPPKFWRAPKALVARLLAWPPPAAPSAAAVEEAAALETTVTPEGSEMPLGMETPEGSEMVIALAMVKAVAMMAMKEVFILAVGWGC